MSTKIKIGVIHKNLSLRDGLAIAIALGIKVTQARRKGEWLIHRRDGRVVRASNGRHDVPQVVVSELRQVAREKGLL